MTGKSPSHYVHVDMRMMGVGGVDSWTRNVENQHLIVPDGEPLKTEFRIVPIKGTSSPLKK